MSKIAAFGSAGTKGFPSVLATKTTPPPAVFATSDGRLNVIHQSNDFGSSCEEPARALVVGLSRVEEARCVQPLGRGHWDSEDEPDAEPDPDGGSPAARCALIASAFALAAAIFSSRLISPPPEEGVAGSDFEAVGSDADAVSCATGAAAAGAADPEADAD